MQTFTGDGATAGNAWQFVGLQTDEAGLKRGLGWEPLDLGGLELPARCGNAPTLTGIETSVQQKIMRGLQRAQAAAHAQVPRCRLAGRH